MTSVALMRAAAVCPGFRFISRAELAVIIEVICWSPMEIFTSAMRPLMRTRVDAPHQLIPSTHASNQGGSFGRSLRPGTEQQAVDLSLGNPVVSAGGLSAANLLLVNPLLDSRKADRQLQSGVAEFK